MSETDKSLELPHGLIASGTELDHWFLEKGMEEWECGDVASRRTVK